MRAGRRNHHFRHRKRKNKRKPLKSMALTKKGQVVQSLSLAATQ